MKMLVAANFIIIFTLFLVYLSSVISEKIKIRPEEVQCVKTDESKMVGGADFDGLLLRR